RRRPPAPRRWHTGATSSARGVPPLAWSGGVRRVHSPLASLARALRARRASRVSLPAEALLWSEVGASLATARTFDEGMHGLAREDAIRSDETGRGSSVWRPRHDSSRASSAT